MMGFMANESRETATDKKTKQLLHYLDLAMYPKIGPEAAVGETPIVQTDVCVMDEDEILPLLQEDKRLTSMNDPEPQVHRRCDRCLRDE